MDLKKYVREVENFPIEGIHFKDITTILQDADAYNYTIDLISSSLEGLDYDVIVAPEARGFLFATPVAYKNKKSFVPIRKKGKLPYKTVQYTYELEYGEDMIEMHIDGVKKGQKVVVIDDLLATGGTVNAICKLLEQQGAQVVKLVFVIELEFINPINDIKKYDRYSIIKYTE